MLRRLLRSAAFCSIAALILSLGACSKDPSTPVPPLVQGDADDVMQVIAGMTALNNGGYLSPVMALYRSNSWPAGPAAQLSRWGALGVDLHRDTTFTVAQMNWFMRTFYRDSMDVSYAGFDQNTRTIDYDASATGFVALGPFQGSTGQVRYGHMSSGFIDNFLDGDVDVHGFGLLDSGLVTVTNDNVNNYYYIDTTSVLEYNFELDGSAGAFPDSGEATIAAFVGDLASPDPHNRLDTMDLLITIKFDGTETPEVTISDNVPDPTTVFRYRLNLTNGTVTRLTALRAPVFDARARRVIAP